MEAKIVKKLNSIGKWERKNFNLFFQKLENLTSKSLSISKEIIGFRKKREEKILERIPIYEEILKLINDKKITEGQIIDYKNLKD